MFLLRDDINEIAALLNQGSVICYPTDTIWGIGCNITEESAVNRLKALKNIPAEEGLIVLVNSIEMLKKYVPDLPPRIETLLSLHNRPFTLIRRWPAREVHSSEDAGVHGCTRRRTDNGRSSSLTVGHGW